MSAQIDPNIHRIDLSRAGTGVVVKMWRKGWTENSAAESESYEPNTRIESLLMRYEDQGFSCWMADNDTGRALRGPIYRIDFLEDGDGFKVKKFPYGWTAKTRPVEESRIPAASLPTALAWCREHGWTVGEWPGGARAWRGEKLPVRDAAAIRQMRRYADQSLREGYSDPRFGYDLKFYF